MIGLRELAALAARYPDDVDVPVPPLRVGDRTYDTDRRPVVMGIVNLSRDSTYRSSISPSPEAAVRRGRVLAAQGADFVDVGAESSDNTTVRVSGDDQVRALVPVIEQLAAHGMVVSVESYEARVVKACLAAGAQIVNLTGSQDDETMFDLAAEHGATVVLCHIVGDGARDLGDEDVADDPIPAMHDRFERRLTTARAHGVDSLVIDPGLGFGFRRLTDPRARIDHQTRTLLNTFRLRRLGVPICHALPHAFDLFEDEFRTAEGFFAVLAHLGGTGVFRTHEVPQVRAVLRSLVE